MKNKVLKMVWLKVVVGVATISTMISTFYGVALAEEYEGDNSFAAEAYDTDGDDVSYDEVLLGEALHEGAVSEEVEVFGETEVSTEINIENDSDIKDVVYDIEVVGALKEYSENGVNYKEVNDGTYSAVSYSGNATSISIPEKVDGRKVTVIAANFLYNNVNAANITSITLTNNINKIEDNAFRGCKNLREIRLGSKENFVMFGDREMITNLTSIGNYAFEGCTSLTSIDLSPAGLATIGEGAFSGCTSLTTVKLAYTITYIGSDAFLNCTGLANGAVYYMRDIEDWLKITYGDNGAGAHANFYAKTTYMTYYTEETGWGFLTEHKYQPSSFVAKDTQRTIPSYAFAGFGELQEVDLTECNTIGAGAFANCSKLYSVELSDILSILGEAAFMNDAHIHNIYLGVGLSSIPSKAFSGCSNLNNLKFTKNITNIESDAFEKCTALSLVYVYTNSKAASYFEYDFKECESGTFVAYVDNTSTYQVDSTLIGYSGLFDGMLGLRFYFTSIGFDDNSVAKFMYTNVKGDVISEEYSFSTALKSNDSYIFTVPINPEDANTKIGAKLIDSNGKESKTYWISFVDYSKQIISNPGKYGTEYNEAIQAILTYCDATQKYFNVGYGSIPAALLLSSGSFYTTADYVSYNSRTIYNINNNDYLGCSLVLEDKLSMKLYYRGDYTDITLSLRGSFTGEIEKCYEVEYVANTYTVVTIKNIYIGRSDTSGSVISPLRIININYGVSGQVEQIDVLSYLYKASNSGKSDLEYLADAISMMDFYISARSLSEKLVQK